MVELWIRPRLFHPLAANFPIRLLRLNPPITDALEQVEEIALELSLLSLEYFFDIEWEGSHNFWIRFEAGKKIKILKGKNGNTD